MELELKIRINDNREIKWIAPADINLFISAYKEKNNQSPSVEDICDFYYLTHEEKIIIFNAFDKLDEYLKIVR